MNREEFMKAKQEEIQQEVDFLREEKAEAKREYLVLEREIRDKIEKIKKLAHKEQGIIDRIKHIDESESQVYNVNNHWMSGTLINYSSIGLQGLATSTFDAEEFGELPEKKEKETKKAFNKIDLQVEQNALLSDMVNLLAEMKKDNELKSAVINRNSLSKALSSQYNREL